MTDVNTKILASLLGLRKNRQLTLLNTNFTLLQDEAQLQSHNHMTTKLWKY